MTETVLIALLTFGAIARMTRAVVEDSITAPLRGYIARRGAASRRWRWLHLLIECTWCASFWIALAFTSGFYLWHAGSPLQWPADTWFELAVSWPAASWAVGIAAQWLDAPPPVRQHEMAPLQIELSVRDQRR